MSRSAVSRWDPLFLIGTVAAVLAAFGLGISSCQYRRLKLADTEMGTIDALASRAIVGDRSGISCVRRDSVFSIQKVGAKKAGYFTYDVKSRDVSGTWQVFWVIPPPGEAPRIEKVMRVQ